MSRVRLTIHGRVASAGAAAGAGRALGALRCGHGHKAHRVCAAQGKRPAVKHLCATVSQTTVPLSAHLETAHAAMMSSTNARLLIHWPAHRVRRR